jgi:nitrate/TMAO reductase-like tetraheme cytochrome c subunit
MDGTLFDDDAIGDADNDMECADCHNGSGAHNWQTEGGVALDPDWEPWDNGRATETEAARFVANTSKECVDCHVNSALATPRFSPTRPNLTAEYTDLGDASHFLGTIDLSSWTHGGPALSSDGDQAGTGGNFVVTPWDGLGYSRMGGAAAATAEFACESCHDLEPDKAITGTANLLHAFNDGIVESRSAFCEGCHSPEGTSTGAPHPMSTDIISKAQDEDRTLTTLVTTVAAGSYAEIVAGGTTTYPADNQMNCDSCHQVHDADSNSGTYILEDTVSLGTPADPVVFEGTSWANMKYDPVQVANKLNYQPFCNLCHLSGG